MGLAPNKWGNQRAVFERRLECCQSHLVFKLPIVTIDHYQYIQIRLAIAFQPGTRAI